MNTVKVVISFDIMSLWEAKTTIKNEEYTIKRKSISRLIPACYQGLPVIYKEKTGEDLDEIEYEFTQKIDRTEKDTKGKLLEFYLELDKHYFDEDIKEVAKLHKKYDEERAEKRAMEEAEDILKRPENYQWYKTVAEAFEKLDEE